MIGRFTGLGCGLVLVALIALLRHLPLDFVGMSSSNASQRPMLSNSPLARKAGPMPPPRKGSPDDLDGLEDDEMDGPPAEVLDAWEADEMTTEIMKNFQSEQLAGKKVVSFRDVYKLLETLGMEKDDFIGIFTGDAELSDAGDYYEEDDMEDDYEPMGRYGGKGSGKGGGRDPREFEDPRSQRGGRPSRSNYEDSKGGGRGPYGYEDGKGGGRGPSRGQSRGPSRGGREYEGRSRNRGGGGGYRGGAP